MLSPVGLYTACKEQLVLLSCISLSSLSGRPRWISSFYLSCLSAVYGLEVRDEPYSKCRFITMLINLLGNQMFLSLLFIQCFYFLSFSVSHYICIFQPVVVRRASGRVHRRDCRFASVRYIHLPSDQIRN